ncbi:MAG: hypothetical protein ACRCZI_02855 [Cetobacterium sp.]
MPIKSTKKSLKSSKKSNKKSKKSLKLNIIKKSDSVKKSEPTKPESSLARRTRERKEREATAKETKKQEEIKAKKEEDRKHKIIYKYVDKLSEKLKEKFNNYDGYTNGYRIWVDKPNAKLSKPLNYYQDLLKKKPEKYKDKRYAEIYVKCYHKEHGKPTLLFRDPDTWIDASIKVFTVKNEKWVATLACKWTWRTDDFKLSKFSFKLMNKLLDVINKDIYTCGHLAGEPLSFMIKNMEKRGVDFGDLLQPLANV